MTGKRAIASWNAVRSRFSVGRLILLTIAVWIIFCIFNEPGSVSPDGHVDGFAGLQGEIRVTLNIKQVRTFTISDGMLMRGGENASSPAYRMASRFEGGPEGVSLSDERVFEGPYLQSPDGRYLAASTMLPDTAAFGDDRRYSFLVRDLKNGRNTLETELSEWKVAGVAWSPDSRRLAILKRKVDIGFCPGDILMRFSGHSIFYSTWVVALVDPEAGPVGTAQLAEGIPGSAGRISWNW